MTTFAIDATTPEERKVFVRAIAAAALRQALRDLEHERTRSREAIAASTRSVAQLDEAIIAREEEIATRRQQQVSLLLPGAMTAAADATYDAIVKATHLAELCEAPTERTDIYAPRLLDARRDECRGLRAWLDDSTQQGWTPKEAK